MDRELSLEVKRARWWRANRAWLIAVAAIAVLAVLGMRHTTPSLDRGAWGSVW